jgi:hypothetical protein
VCLDTLKISQTSEAFSDELSGKKETIGDTICCFIFSLTASSLVVLSCFRNSAGAMGNSMDVSFILLHLSLHKREYLVSGFLWKRQSEIKSNERVLQEQINWL